MSIERTAIHQVLLEDLDLDGMQSFVSARGAYAYADAPDRWRVVAQQMSLIARTGTKPHPTPVGLLCFGHHPQLFHPEWGIAAVQVRGRTLADPIETRHDLEGPIPVLLERALRFVAERTATLNEGAEEYPAVALREALINAMVHRDLRKSGRISLRLFHDRLEVHNPGGIGETTVGDFDEMVQRGGLSVPRNPILAATVRRLGLMDQVGRGLPVMRRALGDGAVSRLLVRATPRDFLVTMPSRFAPPSGAPS
ncbi:MAG: ATP-binding protein [Myxococcota bacterium]